MWSRAWFIMATGAPRVTNRWSRASRVHGHSHHTPAPHLITYFSLARTQPIYLSQVGGSLLSTPDALTSPWEAPLGSTSARLAPFVTLVRFGALVAVFFLVPVAVLASLDLLLSYLSGLVRGGWGAVQLVFFSLGALAALSVFYFALTASTALVWPAALALLGFLPLV
jgi:hypothetical protein